MTSQFSHDPQPIIKSRRAAQIAVSTAAPATAIQHCLPLHRTSSPYIPTCPSAKEPDSTSTGKPSHRASRVGGIIAAVPRRAGNRHLLMSNTSLFPDPFGNPYSVQWRFHTHYIFLILKKETLSYTGVTPSCSIATFLILNQPSSLRSTSLAHSGAMLLSYLCTEKTLSSQLIGHCKVVVLCVWVWYEPLDAILLHCVDACGWIDCGGRVLSHWLFLLLGRFDVGIARGAWMLGRRRRRESMVARGDYVRGLGFGGWVMGGWER